MTSQSVHRSSRLIRFGLWVLVFATILTISAMVYEWISLMQSMPNQDWVIRVVRLIALGVANLVFTAMLVLVAVLYWWVRMARSLPDLKGWHLQTPESEFRAVDVELEPDYAMHRYLAKEDDVFRELDDLLTGPWVDQARGDYSRFNIDSVFKPKTVSDRNWNRTHILESDNPIGGVLLLHGLSDSPYSLRALGLRLHDEGYTVIWLRIPGHGTTPRALADVSWEDWAAAVKVAARHLRSILPDSAPLVIGGYSNGGALGVHYALSTLDDDTLPKVDSIVLLSPMIGINPLARITRLYHTVAMVSRNEKAQWSKVFAEIDPFKYNSWPMNANVQAWNVTKAVERRITQISDTQMKQMPPILAMQSVVDSTVAVPKLITVLFDRLQTESSELFLFDVNRVDRLCNLVNLSFERSVLPTLERTDRPYGLTVLQNVKNHSHQLTMRTRRAGSWSEQPVDAAWPDGVVSLSHIALPIPQHDPIYGDASELSLGTLSMRAEPSALMIPTAMMVRCRYNPFYDLMEDRIVGWLERQRA